jgi:hypothetical protein
MSQGPSIVQYRGSVQVPNGDGTYRVRHVTLQVDMLVLWRLLASTAATNKTGRAVLGHGAVRAVRQGGR